MNLAQIILFVVLVYALIGLAVALAFVCRGITRVDAAANGSSKAFRALILPGAAALWPMILREWRHVNRKETPHDSH